MKTKPKWNYLLVTDSELGGCCPILVRYRCAKQEVSKDEIEDAISSYWEGCKEPDTDEQMVEEVMSSFEGLEFEILPYEEIRY